MTSIPSNLARVPSMLSTKLSLANIGRTSVSMLRVQQQISTGRDILRPSDDIVRSATIGVLDDRLERSTQLRRNMSHAQSALGVLESALAEGNTVALDAKSIASQQSNLTASASERAGQANVVDQLIQSLFNTANRQGVAGYVLGGSRTTTPPVEAFLGGYRYRGEGGGLTTDLGEAAQVPITLSGGPIAGISSRVRGTADLAPGLTMATRLSDLNGARGLGAATGIMNLSINGSADVAVDLSNADTVSDVAARITAAVRDYEAANSVTVLGPGGVSVTGESISFDLLAGPPAASLQFSELASGSVAADLGLTGAAFDSTNTFGASLDPKLTWTTPVSSLGVVVGSLGSIRINNAGRSAVIDLSTATTLEGVKNAIESANLGVRVVLSDNGTGIDVLNDVAAGSAQALSIEEVPGNNRTATRLGIRTLSAATRIGDFNFGRGVKVIDGATNPLTGAADPSLNTDVRITLGNGTNLDIDLRPQDMVNVQTVIDRINLEASLQLAAAGLPSNSFAATLADGSNGIALFQSTSLGGQISVRNLNNSPAAEQLGLSKGTWDAANSTYIGEDRAKVRVESLFTNLIDLRESLRNNNTIGIGLAGEAIESSISAFAETRGLVGAYAQRVETATLREEDRALLDETTRSGLRDADYTTAASRYTLLQTQLQAALQVTALSRGQSLLDYL